MTSTTSTPSPDLAKLQKAIKDIQSLPTPLKENTPNNTNNTTATLQAYQTAKQHYLTQRTTELFLEHLQQYDTRTNTLPLPTLPTARERTALKSRQERVLSDIRTTVSNANNKMVEMERGYDQLMEKREELIQIVEGLERAERQRVMDNQDELYDDTNEEEEEGITEEQVQNEQEKLRELQQRKLQLEERLQSVRSEIMTVEEECQRTKGVVNEVRGRTGRLPLDWGGFYTDSTATTATGDDGGGDVAMGNDREYIAVQTEIDTLQEKAAELKQSGQFYDGIRELMEELGGVKILSSNAHSDGGGGNGGDGFTLTLLLLESHVLEITLEKGTNEDGGLVVRGAKLTTPTTFPMPESRADTTATTNNNHNNEDTQTMTDLINQSLTNISFSKIMSQKQTVSITIPPLDDLVTWSHSLEPSQGIRFVLVETMARIRTLDARVNELTYLRAHYAAQVYDIETAITSSSSSSSHQQQQFGGAEQEVVCAINEGITVALRLSVDCPLVPGSVYVSEMVGVGGWEEEKLNVLKRVVEERRCKGPVEVMEVMVKEIRRRRNEEGWAIPLTPSLPRGRK